MEQYPLWRPGGRGEDSLTDRLRRSGELSARFGLTLSEDQLRALVEQREQALRDTGRLEFGESILPRLIEEFCDSPYLSSDNWEEVLSELQDSFYYFKYESMDRLSDEELLCLMKTYFDGICQGSVEYLSGTSLEELCRRVREGDTNLDQYGGMF